MKYRLCYTISTFCFSPSMINECFLLKVLEGFKNKRDIDGISKHGMVKTFQFTFFSKYM